MSQTMRSDQLNWLDAVHTPMMALRDGIILYANAACETCGLGNCQPGSRFIDFVAPDSVADVMALLTTPRDAGVRCRIAMFTTVNMTLAANLTWSPIVVDHQPAQLLTLNDVSDLQQIEIWMMEEYKRQRTMANLTSSFDFTATIQDDGRFVSEWISPSLTDLTGYPIEKMRDLRAWVEVVLPDDRLLAETQFAEVRDGAESDVEYRIEIAGGDIRWVRVWIAPERDEASGRVQRVFGSVQDITQRVLTQQALRDSEYRLKNVMSHLPLNIFAIDRKGILTFSDGSSVLRQGRDAGDTIGKSIYDLYGHESEFVDNVHAVLAGATIERETVWQGFVVQTYLAPLYDEHGHIIGALGMGIDITERKRMEQAMLENSTLRANFQKEVELSQLKTKMMQRIAHEFRTPLSTIQLSAQMIERYNERMKPEDRAVRVDHIIRQTKHLTRLLEDISLVVQAKSHRIALTRYQFDLEQLCETLIDDMRGGIGADREWSFTVMPEAKVVSADARLISLILQNLLSNAVKFSESGSPIEVIATLENDLLVISVRDQGIGIVLDEQEQVFEPFYRGSNFDERPGMGLGLSIVRDAVNQHNGEMMLHSAPGAGTTVIIKLPVSSAA
jgi:PAS domain S-box-containing protein